MSPMARKGVVTFFEDGFVPGISSGLACAWGNRVAGRPGLAVESGSLEQWMERYANGDDRVFEHVYRLLAPQLRRFCRRLASSASEADDLFQETFLRVHRARATYVPGARVVPWVLAIARSAYLDRLKYRRRRPEYVGVASDVSEEDRLQADESSGPEAQAIAHGLSDVVTNALRSMSERNRCAYVLLKEQDLSVKEAAAVLGTTVSVVKQRAHRAYEHLRMAVQSAGWKEEVNERSRDVAPSDF